MIKSLSVTNFQKLGTREFHFTPGLNLIVGANWAGKSSLIRAILYAMGGPLLARAKAEHLTTWGAKSARGEKGMEVALSFGDLDIVRGPNKASLHYRGELVATGQTPVTAEIGHVLGLPVPIWSSFYVTRQGEAGDLLSTNSARLATYLNQATGVDIVDFVLEQCKGDLTVLEARLIDYPARVAAFETAQVEASKWEEQAAQAALRQQELASQQAPLLARLSELEAQLGDWKRQQQAWREAQAVRSTRLNSLKELKARRAELVEPAPFDEAELIQVKAALADRQARQARRAQQGRELDDLAVNLGKAQQSLEASRLYLRSLGPEVDLEALEAETASAHARHMEVSLELASLEGLLERSFCPTCRKPYTEQALDREAQEQRLEALKAGKLKTLTAWSAYTEQLRGAQALSANRAQGEQRARDWEQHLDRLEAQAAELSEAMEPAVEEAPELSARARELDELQLSHVRYRTERDTHDRGIALAEQQLAGLPLIVIRDPAELEALERDTAAARGLVDAHRSQMTEATMTARSAHTHRDLARKTRSETEAQVAEGRTLVERQVLVSRLRKYLTGNRDQFLHRVWDQILSYASAFIAQATEGDVSALRRSGSGDFVYVEHGHERPIELASGMQEAILGVALKLSLGAALGGQARFMLFDEVAAAGREETALTLTGLLARESHQVILVSHREADAAVAANVIEI